MELQFIPEEYDQLIRLAKHISSFKTNEMETMFARLIERQINPRAIVKEQE